MIVIDSSSGPLAFEDRHKNLAPSSCGNLTFVKAYVTRTSLSPVGLDTLLISSSPLDVIRTIAAKLADGSAVTIHVSRGSPLTGTGFGLAVN